MKIAVFDPQSLLYSLKAYEIGFIELDNIRIELTKEITDLAAVIKKAIEEVNRNRNNDDLFKQSKIKKITEQQNELKQKQEISSEGLKQKEVMLMEDCSAIVSEIVNDYCKTNGITVLFNQSSVAYLDETNGESITLVLLKLLDAQDLINDYGKQLIIKYEK